MNQRVTVSQRRVPWWIGLITGVLVALCGLALLIWPAFAAVSLLAAFIGAALIVSGIAACVRATPLSVVWGIIVILLGIVALAFPDFTANVLVSFGGVFLVLIGIGLSAVGARLGAGFVIPGVLLIVGGVVAFIWPTVALAFIACVCGVALLVAGVLTSVRAVRLRKTRVDSTTIIVE